MTWDWNNIDWGLIAKATQDTLLMTGFSLLGAIVIGLPLGVYLFLTGERQLLANKLVYQVLAVVVNFFRSVPFIILIVWMIPVTRFIVGGSIGVKGAIPPLIVGAAPFFARLVENALRSLDPGISEACKAMGANVRQTVLWALLPEAKTGLISATVVTAILLIGYTAIAGFIGAGGLGDVAINYGYYRYENEMMMVTVLLLVFLVQLIEVLGHRLVQKYIRK